LITKKVLGLKTSLAAIIPKIRAKILLRPIDPIATAALGSDRFGSGFSSIIYNAKGEVSGVITNRANFSWVESELNQVYSVLKEQSLNSAELTVINKNGFVIAELDPSSNGGDEHVKQNFDVLLKLNLVEKDVFAAKELVNGRSGSSYSFHVRKNIMQAAGYSVVDSSKWISSIGWGVMVRDTPEELLHGINAMKKNFLIALGFSSLAVFIGVLFFAGRFSKSFLAVTEKLQEVAEATTQTSQSLSEAAQSVASATSEQAAAVQESVSSMSEITSMIAQTYPKRSRVALKMEVASWSGWSHRWSQFNRPTANFKTWLIL
jgi:methyl-accepting chemotaxis protein